MSKRMNPKQAALRFRNLRGVIGQEIARAEQEIEKEAVNIAHKWSSGGASARVLALLGHPYGRGTREHTAFNPALINKQSELFYNSWTAATVARGGSRVVQLRNSAPYAVELERGKFNTIPRPFRAAILKDLLPIRRRILKQALRRIRGKL